MSDHVAKATEYELFVQKIYQLLYAAEGFDDSHIQHNVTLTGLSGATHQLDLYWEFTLAGICHRVAVECKNYTTSIKQEKILSFSGVLNDLPGSIQGIYVTKVGYQRGALQFARSCGIYPMVIREPIDDDWTGRVKDIVIELKIRTFENPHIDIEPDCQWAKANMPELVKADNSKPQFLASSSETFIEDQDKQETKSLIEYQQELPMSTVGKDLCVEYEYQNAYLICSGTRCKIQKISIHYDVCECTDTIHIKGDERILAIVKNLSEPSTKLIDVDGNVKDVK